MTICRETAAREGSDLSDDIVRFIAAHSPFSVLASRPIVLMDGRPRDEQVVKANTIRVLAFASLTGSPVTLELAWTVLYGDTRNVH